MTRSVKFILLITTMLAMTSLAANGTELIGNIKVTVAQPQTVTQKERVRVSVQRIQKPKVFVGKPHRFTPLAYNWCDDFVDTDDVITSYRRKDLQEIKTDPTDKNPEGLSEEIQWRLFLARQLALMKHREIHGT